MVRWYYLASGFFLLQGIQAFDIVDRLVYGEWLGKPGDKITQGLNILLIITSILLFGRGVRKTRSIQTGILLAIGLAAFLLLSTFWSIMPSASFRGGILYLFFVVGAIGVAGNLKCDEFMDLLARTCFLSAIASLFLLVVSPANAFGSEGDFRGIFSQKNVLGEAMTMGALASLHGLRASKCRLLRNAVFLVVITITALRSESATSCLAILWFCATDMLIALIRKGGAAKYFALIVIVSLVPVVVLSAAFPDSMLEMIGKDPTLTGRTDIWGLVIPDIYQRPWLGWGYVAFWSPDNPAAMEIADLLHWFAPQAHNGILEMLLNVGLVGTALFIFLWARNVRLAVKCMRTAEKVLAISCLFSCTGIILVGISETVLIVPMEASTSVFFITGLFCEQAIYYGRRRSTTSRHLANRAATRPQATARAAENTS